MRPEHLQALLGPDGCLSAALADGLGAVLRIDGGCMTPDLAHHRPVRVERAGFFWPGDVVVFHCPYQGRLLMHRCLGYVRRRGTWTLMTMADRGIKPDVLVDLPRVLGRIAWHADAPYRVPARKRIASLRRYLFWCSRLFIRSLNASVRRTPRLPSARRGDCQIDQGVIPGGGRRLR